jgi:hypothetical protein
MVRVAPEDIAVGSGAPVCRYFPSETCVGLGLLEESLETALASAVTLKGRDEVTEFRGHIETTLPSCPPLELEFPPVGFPALESRLPPPD